MPVTDDSQLRVTISSSEAGTTEGQLILDDVEFRKERDNEEKHGIGHSTPQGVRLGNVTYYVSATAHMNSATTDLILATKNDGTLTGKLRTPNLIIDVGKLDWNDVRVEASDGGDATLSVEFTARQYEERRASEDDE